MICGWCAVSYAICVGVFAETHQQSNGFGAISIVILAAIGGLMVPSFAMDTSLKTFANFSPMHWCLQAYYGLFLEGGKLSRCNGVSDTFGHHHFSVSIDNLFGIETKKFNIIDR